MGHFFLLSSFSGAGRSIESKEAKGQLFFLENNHPFPQIINLLILSLCECKTPWIFKLG